VLRGLAARTTPDGEVQPSPAPGRPLELDPHARLVLRFDDGDDILTFASDPQAATLSQIGPATPDHLITTRRTTLYVPAPTPAVPQSGNTSLRRPERSEGPAASTTVGSQSEAGSGVALDWQALADALTASLEPAWREWLACYVEYVRASSPNAPAPAPDQVDVRPRVVLLPGVGMVTLGRDARATRQAADVYRHAVRTIRAAQALERYTSLSAQDCFDVEFWPLELYKLTLARPEAELSRRVALVTGAGSGIGRAIAERFAAEGAHVCVVDLNAASAEAVADALSERHGAGRAIAMRANVANEVEVAAVFARTVEAFGGLDIVVSNAGIAPFSAIDEMALNDWQRAVDVNATGNFLVVREAMRLFKRQGIGGNVICVATKNVMAPGKEFGAYSASKAAQAQLARVAALEGGDYGVRVNMINPDAVFRGSTLWSPELRRARAQAHRVQEEQLGDFYRQRCLLGVPIYPEDVAEAAWWLATDRTSKMTGGVITVDGGVAAAFPR
jgi:NAD(P)-dependent dehydrogenase (short-subunit alcohol dehydrogenase family)